MRQPLLKVAAGLVGGAVSTYLITKAMGLSSKLPERVRWPAPKEHPGEFMIRQVERLSGRRFSKNMHTRAAQGLQWAYGLAGPIALAALADALRLRSAGRTMVAGAALGALVWAIGYAGWLPLAGLTPPVHKVPVPKSATALASHVAYGAVAALPLALTAPRVRA
jgi:hypothetical protein